MAADHRQALLERDVERAAIASLIHSATEGFGGVVLIEGPPGIGKTQLLREARQRAREAGLRALSARCDDSERNFSFGVVRQLYEPAMAGHDRDPDAMAGLAALARPLFTPAPAGAGLGGAEGELHDQLHGLYWLTSNLAERGPMLLALDDAHSADVASLRFLSFLIRRVDELPIALVLTTLPGARGSQLPQIRASPATQVLRPAPLSCDAVAAVVEQGLHVQPDDTFCAACCEVTGGNPWLVRALLDELLQRGIAPSSDHVHEIQELGPHAIADSVLQRIALLTAPALHLSQAVAVLGNGAELRHAAAVADLETPAAAEAADALVDGHVLEPGRPLRFVHSIVRSAVYAALPHARRTGLHDRAAAVLARDGAVPAQVAAHLLRTDPRRDATTVTILRAAAHRAVAGDAPEFAISCLQRALIEPPGPEIRSALLVELGLAEARGPGREGLEWLRRGIDLTTDSDQRAQIALQLVRAIGSIGDTAGALEVLDGAIAGLHDVDERLAARLAVEFISVGRLYPATRERAVRRLEELTALPRSDDVAGALLAANEALLAVEEVRPLEEAVEPATRALRGAVLFDEQSWVLAYAANTLMWTDHTAQAEGVWTEVLGRARRTGSMSCLILASAWRSHLAYRVGDVAGAEDHARLCLNICRQRDWDTPLPYALAFLGDALLERGELEATGVLVDEACCGDAVHYLLHTRGRLRCIRGDLHGGVADFLECGRQLTSRGGGDNPTIIPWRSSAVEALVRLGELREASRLADEELDLARRFGAGRAIGVALRTAALTSGCQKRVDLLQEAIRMLEVSSARLERARALVDLADGLRRASRRQESQAALRAALHLANECGATALRERVQDELVAVGLRPQRYAISGLDALTTSERRVADMAGDGLTNREIGQALFVSLKTVEAHLRSVYRKLDIHTRLQLRHVLEGHPSSDVRRASAR